jgi:hypothetical protein
MPGKFYPVPLRHLLNLILNELGNEGSIFGIPQELFFVPGNNKVVLTEYCRRMADGITLH